MKPAPAAFQQLRDSQAEAQRIASERSAMKQREHDAAEERLQKQLRAALEPYDDTEIDGLRISIKADDKKTLFFVNETLWLTFEPKWNWSSCHCENVCDCVTSYWLSLTVTQHKTTGTYGCYFQAGVSDLNNPQVVAESIDQMLQDWKWRDR